MNAPPAPAVEARRSSNRCAWLVVLVVLLLVVCVRVRVLNMPLERDEGEYAYAGQLILQGIPPYQLAYNMKLPGTYYAYAAGMAMFGQTATGVHLTLLVVNAVAILFVFLLGRSLFGATAGAFAAASYGLITLSPAVLGMAAHANHFVVLFALPATLLLWRACKAGRAGLLFPAGLLFGLSLLMKQQAVFFAVFGFVFLVWSGLKDRSGGAAVVKRGAIFGLGVLAPFAVLCLLLWQAGVFAKFWFWTFTYARSYATSISVGEGIGRFADYARAPLHWNVLLGFLGLALAGLVLSRKVESLRSSLEFLLLLTLFSGLATATGFYFRPHYFIQVLPALALMAGLAVSLLQVWLAERVAGRIAQIIPVGLFAGVAVWGIVYQRDFLFRMSPDEIVRASYDDEHFSETVAVAGYIRAHSGPNDTVAVVGSEPQVYFHSGRHSATGYIYTYALMEPQPHALAMQKEMEGQIEHARPKFLVEAAYPNSWAMKPDSQLEIFDWFRKYASALYERVGLLDLTSPNARFLWGDDALKFNGNPEEYLAVYQRKGE